MASNLIGKIIIWAVALFYTYGALVHIMNILGLSGFDWAGAPLKWQLLDIVYLFLDVVVAVGFFAGYWTCLRLTPFLLSRSPILPDW